jgi:hypothetical protein
MASATLFRRVFIIPSLFLCVVACQGEDSKLKDLARDYQIAGYFIKDGILVDKIEQTSEFTAAERFADQEATEYLMSLGIPDEGLPLGNVHLYWTAKQQILQKKFGIKWRTPADMNPWICFD